MRLKKNIVEKFRANFSVEDISEALNCSKAYMRRLKCCPKKLKGQVNGWKKKLRIKIS